MADGKRTTAVGVGVTHTLDDEAAYVDYSAAYKGEKSAAQHENSYSSSGNWAKRKLNRMSTSKLWTVCIFILVVEMCERLTYYTFAGSQRNHLQILGFSNAQSTSMNAAFSILCYITPLLGGWIADAYLGRYWAIIIFTLVYIVGVSLACAASYPTVESTALYLFGTMGLITLGSGGIKPNIANFGGDQYDITDPEQVKEQQSFFNYFYLVINVGAVVAFGYLVTLATNGQPPTIPRRFGFFAAYAIATGCFGFCALIFIAGTPRYVRNPPGGNSLRGLFYYLGQAAKRSIRGTISLCGWVLIIVFLISAVTQAFITDPKVADSLSYFGLVIAVFACTALITVHQDNEYLNDIPEEPSGMITVCEVKAMLDTVPTLLVVNIAFSICYNQLNGAFQAQACQMNLIVGSGQINGAFFNIGDCFAIIAFTPLYEMVILPMIARLKGSNVTGMQQLVAGLSVSALAMFVAAGLEYARRAAPVLVNEANSNCAPPGVPMSDISGFLMFIPFALIGVGEVLVNPYMYYFAYVQTPPRARSLSQAFNLLCSGSLSNGFTAAIITAMTKFFPKNLNTGHIEYFYYVGAAVALAAIPLTVVVSRNFVPKSYNTMADDPVGVELARIEADDQMMVDPTPDTDPSKLTGLKNVA